MALASGLAAPPAMANPAGPHLDGNGYDALRPATPLPTLTFTMDVECPDPGRQGLPPGGRESGAQPGRGGTRAARWEGRSLVTLGPDFVISRGGYGASVHDFRFRRHLVIGTGSRRFSNDSLYGHFFVRWQFLSNNLRTLAAASAGVSLPRPLPVARFLQEHANGIRHPAARAFKKIPAAALNADRRRAALVANVGNMEVLKARFGGMKFPSAAHGRSFGAWLVWFIRIHPSLTRLLADDAALPSSLRFIRPDTTKAMSLSEPAACNAVLSGVSRGSGRLDVVAGLAPEVKAWPPWLPESLTRLMIDAVRLRAPNGPTGNAEYSRRMRRLVAERRYFDAALLSLHAAASTGACSAAPRDARLCDTIGETLRAAKSDRAMQTLMKARSLRAQDNHRGAAEVLIPLRGRSPSRPDILEIMIANDLVEARRRSQLTQSLRKEFDGLPNTLEAALARDPYSPARYRDIANYLGVAGRSLEDRYAAPVFQHTILDLGRALPGGASSPLLRNTTATERRIAKDFPGLFPEVADPPE